MKDNKRIQELKKYKKMWKKLLLKCAVMSGPEYQEVIKWMRELEKGE